MNIAGKTLEEWTELARRDDCFDKMVPSDLRVILGRISDLESALKDSHFGDRFNSNCVGALMESCSYQEFSLRRDQASRQTIEPHPLLAKEKSQYDSSAPSY